MGRPKIKKKPALFLSDSKNIEIAFTKRFAGYDTSEVDEVIDILLEKTKELLETINETKNEQETERAAYIDLSEQFRKAKAEWNSERLLLVDAMTVVRKDGEQITAVARQNAEQIIGDAQRDAEQTVATANQEADEVQKQIETELTHAEDMLRNIGGFTVRVRDQLVAMFQDVEAHNRLTLDTIRKRLPDRSAHSVIENSRTNFVDAGENT